MPNQMYSSTMLLFVPALLLLAIMATTLTPAHGQSTRNVYTRQHQQQQQQRDLQEGEEEGDLPDDASPSPFEDLLDEGSPINFTVNNIVGGSVPSAGRYPFFVKFEGAIVCGGALISPNRVLTAGHCVAGNGSPQFVRVGTSDGVDGVRVRVKCAELHPNFETPFTTVLHDIAILKLEESVGFDSNGVLAIVTENDNLNVIVDSQSATAATTATIVFNRQANYPLEPGTPLTVIGFGKTSTNGGDVSNQLRQLNTQFVSTQDCQATYDSQIVQANMHLCADVQNAGDCNGDSGGPLFDSHRVLVGLVSFGYGGCASNDYQDVYTKVSAYQAWIDQEVNDDTCANIVENEGPDGANGCGLAVYWRTAVETIAQRASLFWNGSV